MCLFTSTCAEGIQQNSHHMLIHIICLFRSYVWWHTWCEFTSYVYSHHMFIQIICWFTSCVDDSFICVTTHMSHHMFIQIICMCVPTHMHIICLFTSYVWRDSSVCVIWRQTDTHGPFRHDETCDLTHSYVWHDSFVSFVWRDSSVCVPQNRHSWRKGVGMPILLTRTPRRESWHTYEWVMAHVWMSHGTRMNESWQNRHIYTFSPWDAK